MGALEGRAAVAFENHLRTCAACRRRLERFRERLERARALEEVRAGELDDERSARIRRKIFQRIRAELDDSDG